MESFVFYTHYAKKMKKLPPEQAASLLYAICDYVENGTEPELDDTAADMCFSFIRTQLDKDIAKYETTCKKRSEAGRRGAAATNGKRRQEAAKAANADFAEQETSKPPSATILPETAPPTLEKPDRKQRKKKDEPPKVRYAEFVYMTEVEHGKLLERYGPEMTDRLIEKLDNYKGSKGKTYSSDYRAILNWVVDSVQEELSKKGGTGYGGSDPDRGTTRQSNFKPSKGFKRADGEE